jgi:hypothetical protein
LIHLCRIAARKKIPVKEIGAQCFCRLRIARLEPVPVAVCDRHALTRCDRIHVGQDDFEEACHEFEARRVGSRYSGR